MKSPNISVTMDFKGFQKGWSAKKMEFWHLEYVSLLFNQEELKGECQCIHSLEISCWRSHGTPTLHFIYCRSNTKKEISICPLIVSQMDVWSHHFAGGLREEGWDCGKSPQNWEEFFDHLNPEGKQEFAEGARPPKPKFSPLQHCSIPSLVHSANHILHLKLRLKPKAGTVAELQGGRGMKHRFSKDSLYFSSMSLKNYCSVKTSSREVPSNCL